MPIGPRPIGLPFRIPRGAWKALKIPHGHWLHKKPKWFWVWRAWRLRKNPQRIKLHMYDDVNVALIPKDAEAVAGYVGGRWPTFDKVVAGWPKAKHLSIAVSSVYDADCLDIEPGDAPIDLAANWIKRQKKNRTQGKHYNTRVPVVYTAASWVEKLVASLAAAGLRYGVDYKLWSAHYTFREHFCNPSCGFGIHRIAHGTQFTDKAGGKSLDESVLAPNFFV